MTSFQNDCSPLAAAVYRRRAFLLYEIRARSTSEDLKIMLRSSNRSFPLSRNVLLGHCSSAPLNASCKAVFVTENAQCSVTASRCTIRRGLHSVLRSRQEPTTSTLSAFSALPQPQVYEEANRDTTGWTGTDCSMPMCTQGFFDPFCTDLPQAPGGEVRTARSISCKHSTLNGRSQP